ncbi:MULTISPECIES: tryptophan synthase subunit alpha [unclassified Duganella]|jgi:tryptophan synthase alpha chain|uniref:tryptophan synthase subunit alpha n=1 Tax=unclassified Duganella TaxID=2636909 RepID=UPI00088D4234|nr:MULTISPECIES: tryptophan synthase subunit alpha [unclassified Duganella]SDF39765.1 tryptophan synthase, alpha chain [Duganella sp. OV458]SDI86783.1 tryptophan synthase, alpha chain [Duganella sp. OV510]
MSNIAATFSALKAQNKTALVTFITAGDPGRESTVPLMHALVAGGADIIELGVPFSDPMAEGPVIQRACERALANGVGIKDVFAYVAEFRKTNQTTPVVLMGYANPIERIGTAEFIARSVAVGADGAIVVDYPPEECEAFAAAMRAAELDLIFLLAPTSTEQRIEQVAKVGGGFSYYVSLKGVTGAGNIDVVDVANRLQAIRKHVKLPVGVGFGIRDGATARAVAEVADAVVIGSRIIQEIETAGKDGAVAAVQAFTTTIRTALDA